MIGTMSTELTVGPAIQRIRVGQSYGKGRGVFALCEFAAGDLIEAAPVIMFPRDDWWTSECNTVLNRYSFHWNDACACLVLGCGSLYNHSADPNVACHCGVNATMEFCANRRIEPGDELFISYAYGSGALNEHQQIHYGIEEDGK